MKNQNSRINSELKRVSKIHSLFQFSSKVLNWMYRIYPISTGSPKVFHSLLFQQERTLKSRGTINGLSYIKALRLAFIKHQSGSTERVEGVKYSNDGMPKIITDFMRKLKINKMPSDQLAVLLTILTVSRSINTKASDDVSSITAPSKQKDGYVIDKHITSFWSDLGFSKLSKNPSSVRWNKFHFTTKNGPNGQALWTSQIDFQYLYYNNKDIQADIANLGGKKLTLVISSLGLICEGQYQTNFPTLDLTEDNSKSKLRKIVNFPDKEGKTRFVAIQDYWSQTALRPLHTWIFSKVLKRIPQDCTFSQGSFKDKLPKEGIYYSIDLTAATDRFPITLIANLLKGRFPDSYVQSWLNVMIKLPFDFNGTLIKYSVGNPMGAYSSWATFALAHHYVVYYCCKELNMNWKTLPYVLLGDDIVIADKQVAELYFEVMHSLGLEISKPKTHVSTSLYEFAKRWIYNGVEITPFPISALKESCKRYYNLVNLLLEVEIKNWTAKCSVPEAILVFYTYVIPFRSLQRKKMRDGSIVSEIIMKIMRDTQPVTSLNQINKQFGIQVPELDEDECKNILANVTVALFADSNPENMSDSEKNKAKPLGLVAQLSLMRMTDPEVESYQKSLGFDQPSKPWYIPQLAAYASIEEQYLELRKKARRVDTIHAGEWPQLLKAMLLPISDVAFYSRVSEMIPYASSVIGTKIKDQMMILASPMGRRLLGR